MKGTWQLKRTFITEPSIQRVGAGLGQQAVGADDGGAGGDILGDHGIGADRRAPADSHPAQNLGAGADIDAVLDLGRSDWSNRGPPRVTWWPITTLSPIRVPLWMTMPIGWGRNTVLGSARPMSQPRKYMKSRLTTGSRCRVKKISIRAASALLIHGFLGWRRMGDVWIRGWIGLGLLEAGSQPGQAGWLVRRTAWPFRLVCMSTRATGAGRHWPRVGACDDRSEDHRRGRGKADSESPTNADWKSALRLVGAVRRMVAVSNAPRAAWAAGPEGALTGHQHTSTVGGGHTRVNLKKRCD